MAHRFKSIGGKVGCQRSLKEIADEAAAKLKPILETYPNVIIGHTEPYGGGDTGLAWIAEIIEWQKLLKQKIGKPVTFFDADIVWSEEKTPAAFAALMPILKGSGLQVGVYYHGLRSAADDVTWANEALRQADLFERQLKNETGSCESAIVDGSAPRPCA